MPSPGASAKSATGTWVPSICTRDWPNWIRAMSRTAGCSTQPDRVTAVRTSSGAPQRAQLEVASGVGIRQYWQVSCPLGALVTAGSLGVVVDVHRLDADPARPGHLGQVEAAPENPGLHVHLPGLHHDRRVLVEEGSRLDQDLLAGTEHPLEHVAVAVQHQHAGV